MYDVMTLDQKAEITRQLRALAEADHAQYPQYKGHWDNWVLGLISKTITGKGGLTFTKGEFVLVDPSSLGYVIPSGPKAGIISPTCYSANRKVNASLGGPHVRLVI